MASRTSRGARRRGIGIASVEVIGSAPAARPSADPALPHGRRSAFGRSVVLLGGAMAGSGLLTYAFLVLTARALGPTSYGQVGVLWGAMYIASIVAFRPLEQTTSRAIADRRARGEDARPVLRSVGLVAGVAMLVLVAGGLAAFAPLSRGLFHGNASLTALLLAGVVLYGVSYLVRGLVGGVMWFPGYGINVLADAATRLVLTAPLLLVASKELAAVAVVGAGLGGAVVPLVVGRRRLRTATEGTASGHFSIGRALSFAAPAGTIAAADQLLVNGAPVLIVIAGGPHASKTAGVAFAATMLVRAPVYVFQGVAAALLPNFTRLQSGDRRRALWEATVRAVKLVSVASVAIVAGAALLGPTVSRILYGARYETTRGVIVALAVGVALYLIASTLSQSLLALDAGKPAAVAWVAGAVVFVIGFFALPVGPLLSLSVAFAAGAAVLTVGLAVALRRRTA